MILSGETHDGEAFEIEIEGVDDLLDWLDFLESEYDLDRDEIEIDS